jgi:hypothetical protein
MGNELIIYEQDNTLIIQEQRNGSWMTITRVVAGAVTEAEKQYFRANVLGRIKQIEADLILKYFYGLDID